MKKLTLSIKNEDKLNWLKAYAKNNGTSISRIFESYIDALIAFDNREVNLSASLEVLRQPGERPSQKEIEKHLASRRNRKARQG